jgi:opacity protein-like surface antigen
MSKSSFCYLISLLLVFILVVPGFGQTRVGKFGVGVDGSIQYAYGASPLSASPGIGYGVNLSYSPMEYFGLRAKFCSNQLGWTTSTANGSKSVTTDMISLNFYASADLMPNSNFNVFPFIGGGLALFDPRFENGTRDNDNVSSSDINYSVGAGADYFINEFWSISFMGEYVITNNPHYVGNSNSSDLIGNLKDDTFIRASIQIRYYFFDQSFIAKLLEAQRQRSKRSK